MFINIIYFSKQRLLWWWVSGKTDWWRRVRVSEQDQM